MNNITSTLEKISKEWIRIAQLLDVPSNIINIIHVSHLKDDKMKLKKVVEWWFKNTPNPEWKIIQVVLEKGMLNYYSILHTIMKLLFAIIASSATSMPILKGKL